eukprot:1143203-Pelagomonas_calceolata.AAC.5
MEGCMPGVTPVWACQDASAGVMSEQGHFMQAQGICSVDGLEAAATLLHFALKIPHKGYLLEDRFPVQHAHKLVSTKRAIENRGKGKGLIAVPACGSSLTEAKRACNQTSPT